MAVANSYPAIIGFIDTFVRIINKYNSLNQRPLDYGTGDKLFPSEIHTLDTIAAGEDVYISELALRLGVTKSAVSQVVIKLAGRGFVRKYKSGDNDKNILLELTDKGKAAVKGFDEFRADIFRDLILELEKMNDSQVEFIGYVLDRIDRHMDFKLEKYDEFERA